MSWWSRIGVDVMLHLLTETSVFMCLPNQCLCQMTGEPIVHIAPLNDGIMVQRPIHQDVQKHAKPAGKRKATACHEDEPPTKRPRSLVVDTPTARGIGKVTNQPTIEYVFEALCSGVLFMLPQSQTGRYLFSSHATFLRPPCAC